MNNMLDYFQIRALGYWDVLDILILWFVIYSILKLIYGTRAMQTALGIMALFLIQVASQFLHLTMVSRIIASLFTIIPVAIIVLFQQEIRKALVSLGRNPFMGLSSSSVHGELDPVFSAVRYFSKHQIGALLVIEQTQGLREYIDSANALDALPNYELLLTIFDHHSNLHDGAVIISENRIACAASVLPLSQNPKLPPHYGTRHRAGFGISEESDAVVIIVSEETGRILFVHEGRGYAPESDSLAHLKKTYDDLFSGRDSEDRPKLAKRIWSAVKDIKGKTSESQTNELSKQTQELEGDQKN